MISQRGLILSRKVATYHTDRLRAMPVGHFFDVITNGYGVMFPQGAKHTPEERWKIVALLTYGYPASIKNVFAWRMYKQVNVFLMARFRVQDDADQEEPTQAYISYVEERDDAVG